ncbi:hypothetical protein EOA13_10030 [Mesorhizobium sp. M7A.F.Ca.US.011.01.1.1]|nr:hypothetical protein X734_06090 [Mesorhizobium sp. L2C084A000]RUW89618.1 hypothetical protein EOA19_23915 [Mesorhizobium sp. M7A.F.Ca.US.010.02.1.1]RUX30135.1 hypothetical protein EOA13_10030 [Mesorhizobium sp. M7A.F.Ca.US.011.01.1.1]
MTSQRYDLRKEPDETWTVFDVFTGQPADAWGAPAEYLDEEYSRDLVSVLNLVDLKRRAAPGNL